MEMEFAFLGWTRAVTEELDKAFLKTEVYFIEYVFIFVYLLSPKHHIRCQAISEILKFSEISVGKLKLVFDFKSKCRKR